MMTMDQATWRSEFERRHTFGLAVLPINPRPTEDTTMARTIKLPARSNANVYDEATVLDIYLTVLAAPKGEGVVIDDNTDTEPKARVRTRNMADALKKGLTVDNAALSDDDADLLGDRVTEDDGTNVTLAPLAVRQHVVAVGENEYAPVVSLKQS